MKSLRTLFIAIFLAVATIATTTAAASAPLWEELAQQSAQQDDAPAIELTVKGGEVILTLQRQTVVEVFTILGQPVSRESLRAGTYRLRLRSRGIYILRAGGITRRITV